VQPLRRGLARFLRIYAAFFLCISALVLAAFAIGTLPSGGAGGVAEGLGFLATAVVLVYLAVRVIRPMRRQN
jgi:membrane protein implicated in regulation of membrane protease activity